MAAQVEFFFDFGSPASYLAWTQLPRIASSAGATIVWRPMLLGGVFKATGNQSPALVPAKGAYMWADLARFATRYGVAFAFNPQFPINTLPLMRGAVAYLDSQLFDRYMAAIFEGLWVQQLNLAEPEVIARVLAEAGIEPGDFRRRIGDPAVKDALMTATEQAVARGVFGAPTMFIGDQMFFGQDRLDWVADVLRSQPIPSFSA